MAASKRTIEVDDATAAALESRAVEAGLSVTELLAETFAPAGASVQVAPAELAELDRHWAAIKAGEPTTPNEDVVRWLQTWGTPVRPECLAGDR
jgi:predicted transcriptional regulator